MATVPASVFGRLAPGPDPPWQWHEEHTKPRIQEPSRVGEAHTHTQALYSSKEEGAPHVGQVPAGARLEFHSAKTLSLLRLQDPPRPAEGGWAQPGVSRTTGSVCRHPSLDSLNLIIMRNASLTRGLEEDVESVFSSF